MISVFDKKEDCCGCTACESICPTKAIKMIPDEEGFVYPDIDQELCIDCGRCRKVCAFQNKYDSKNNLNIPDVYGIKHLNDKIRKNSSSGGAFTAISDYILEKKGSVCGVKFDEEMRVIHALAKSEYERNNQRGSKYVQSDLKRTFFSIKKLLLNNESVLFTGTPCQTAGLSSFLELSKCDTNNLLLCDIVCHGTPSPMLWKDYLKFLEKKKGKKVKNYYFRSKVKGWHEHTEVAVFDDNQKDYKSNEVKVFKSLFYSHNALRPACHNCKYSNITRPSDLTIADFRGIEKFNKDFDDNKGISLVLINTAKGRKVFEEINNQFESIKSNLQDCMQRNLINPTPISKKRDVFWQEYYDNGFEYIAKKYAGYNLKSIMKGKLKAYLINTGLFKFIKR